MSKPYSVNLWGSEPGQDDDCWIGDDFGTFAEAHRVYCQVDDRQVSGPHLSRQARQPGTWAELIGPGVRICRQVTADRIATEVDTFDQDWLREIAMQDGMVHGVSAYNDQMGWS